MPLSVVPPRTALRVVLVDDREERRRLVRLVLCRSNLDLADVTEADSAPIALQVVHADGANVVLLEIQMPGGLALITSLRSRYPELVIVVCTFQTSSLTKQLALDAGADSYLNKPVRSGDLYRAIVGARTTRSEAS
jgi:CheY-like chemotaxis protein